MKNHINDVDLIAGQSISEVDKDLVRKILESEEGEVNFKYQDSFFLIGLYLDYIEPHELANGYPRQQNITKKMSCGKCIAHVRNYFKKLLL